MVKMKPASSPRAATRHPAEARRRAEARTAPQSAVDGEDEARELPARRHPTPRRRCGPRGSGALAAAWLVVRVDDGVCRVKILRDCLQSRPIATEDVNGRSLRLRRHKVLAACGVALSIPRDV